ncbi:hypothetical protein [Amycolatopsis pigmentata]|uniref:SUKH-4 immunity protein n=1 Tax=Amycolatopsis pigmentata TaxID=450801 RepID=A0ABW5FR54_9PSEU
MKGATRFAYAADGRVKTAFEAGAYSGRWGDDPDCLSSVVADVDWETYQWQESLLVLAARITGQPCTEDWLDGDVLIAPIAQHVEDVRPVTPGFEPLEYQHPVLAAALRRADDEALMTVARAAVDGLVASSGLPGVPDDDAEFEEMIRMARYEAGTDVFDDDHLWFAALDAVRVLRLAPNPLTAAFRTIATAELAKRRDNADPAPLLAGFLELLGNPPAPSGSDGAVAGDGGPLERHAWITDHWLGLSASITYARGIPLDTVAAAFGDVALGTGPVSLTDTEQVALRREGEWTLAIAFNRRPFSQKVVDALRPHGTVLCIDWETNGNRLVYYAEPGSDVAVMRPEHRDAPPLLAPYTASLPAPASNAAPWLLALGEVITGIAFTPDGLDAQHTLIGPGPGEPELRAAGPRSAGLGHRSRALPEPDLPVCRRGGPPVSGPVVGEILERGLRSRSGYPGEGAAGGPLGCPPPAALSV